MIWLGCLSAPVQQVFGNGIMLLFLTSLGMNGVAVMLSLSLVQVFSTCLLLPTAHLSDRWGKKRLGLPGIMLMGLAFAGFSACCFVGEAVARMLAVLLIGLYAVGLTAYTSGLFAIMTPLIPEAERARFFGKFRFSWQTVSAIIGMSVSAILARSSTHPVFAGVFVFMMLMTVGWYVSYSRLPEVDQPAPRGQSLGDSLGVIMRTNQYMSFCAYAFLLALLAGGCPILFGLVEKVYMQLSDGTVTLLANIRLMAQIGGFVAGAWAVERHGTKSVFLACHFGFGLAIFIFLARGLAGGAAVPVMAVAEALFGLLSAASSVAFTTEMMALIPAENKSMSTSLFVTLQGAGVALSGLLSAGAIQLGLFRSGWMLAGSSMSEYDAALIINGMLVVVIVVTLGLVPSVIGKLQWTVAGKE